VCLSRRTLLRWAGVTASGLVGAVRAAGGTRAPTIGATALAQSAALPDDWDVPDGHFFRQAVPSGAPPGTGYIVSDTDGVQLWRDYQALGGAGLLGYPVSSRYQADGRLHQAFQAALLQWNPDAGAAEVAPVLAAATAGDLDDALAPYGVPPADAVLRAGGDPGFETREGWLTQPTLRDAYVALGGADRTGLLGLPMSAPVRQGAALVQRFERGALQLWLEEVPDEPEAPDVSPPGTVGLVPLGEALRSAGLLPAAAVSPQAAPAPPPASDQPTEPGTEGGTTPAAQAAGAPSAPGGGRAVVVSRGRQWLYAYDSGALVYNSPVTTGRPELPTPLGQFSVLSRHSPFTFISPWPAGSPYWYPPSPVTFALRITGNGVFLHDAPWRDAFGPGTNLPQAGSLRTGSHGCINLPYATARFLWGFAPLGTSVSVIE
jgi:lipoprotein-anchoring transpeptidase ErfK/SrfK